MGGKLPLVMSLLVIILQFNSNEITFQILNLSALRKHLIDWKLLCNINWHTFPGCPNCFFVQLGQVPSFRLALFMEEKECGAQDGRMVAFNYFFNGISDSLGPSMPRLVPFCPKCSPHVLGFVICALPPACLTTVGQ